MRTRTAVSTNEDNINSFEEAANRRLNHQITSGCPTISAVIHFLKKNLAEENLKYMIYFESYPSKNK